MYTLYDNNEGMKVVGAGHILENVCLTVITMTISPQAHQADQVPQEVQVTGEREVHRYLSKLSNNQHAI